MEEVEVFVSNYTQSDQMFAINQKYVILDVTASDLINGRIELPIKPNLNLPLQLFPSGGPKQVIGQAFNIEGKFLIFRGYGLDNVLIEGDQIELYYYWYLLRMVSFIIPQEGIWVIC